MNYRRELEDLTLHEAARKLFEIIALTKVEEAAVAELTEKVKAERAALDAREAELEVVRQKAHLAEEQTEAAQKDAFVADNEVRTHETEGSRAKDKLFALDERRAAAQREQVDLERTIGELIVERDQLQGQLGSAAYVCAAHAKVVIVGKFFRTRSPSDFVRALLSSVVEAAMMMCSASFWPAMRGISELRLPQVPSVVGR